MRFEELGLQTRRERPARARTDGEALLIRAGYEDGEGHLTELGRRTAARLSVHCAGDPEWAATFQLKTLRTADDQIVADTPAGPFRMLHCENCGYAAAADAAEFRKPKPPPEPLLPIARVQTPGCSTIEALAAFLQVPSARTAKAMLYWDDAEKRLVFVLIRGDMQVSQHKLHQRLGKWSLASDDQIKAAGAVAGYASPIGVEGVYVVADDSIPGSGNLVAGANEGGFHLLNTNPGRDYRVDRVEDIALARPEDPCVQCGSPLRPAQGMLLADRAGIDIEAVLHAIADQHHDDRGLAFPPAAAPFHVHVLHLPAKELDTRSAATQLYEELLAARLDVLFDDRDERAGVKFNDADLIGCPLRLTVGEKTLANRMVELKHRRDPSGRLIPLDQTVPTVRSETSTPND